jgi:hypothetical protein
MSDTYAPAVQTEEGFISTGTLPRQETVRALVAPDGARRRVSAPTVCRAIGIGRQTAEVVSKALV